MYLTSDLNLSKNWSFTCLSVTKTAKSNHPCIGKQTNVCCAVLAATVPVWLYGRLNKRLNYIARFWISAIVSKCQSYFNWHYLQRYLNWPSATTSRRSYDFLFTTPCCACGNKQLWHRETDFLKFKNKFGINPFMPSGYFYLNSLVRSISSKGGVWLVFIISSPGAAPGQLMPSWNSSNHISSQTVSQIEPELDGRHQGNMEIQNR